MDCRSIVVSGDRSSISPVSDQTSIPEQQKAFAKESGDKVLSSSQKRRARQHRKIARLKDTACRALIASNESEESHKIEVAELKERYSKTRLCERLETVTEIAKKYKSDRDKLQTDQHSLQLKLEKYERTHRDSSADLVRNFLVRDTLDRSGS